LRQIVENAGQEGSIVLQAVENLPETQGYNALTGEYTDMIKSGILDPTKVSRCALENAASVAALLITTEALIADAPEEKEEAKAPAMEY
jgi:chaperonin GroEL